MTEFGSLANGSPVYTTDPATIQSLANYLTGWFSGVVGSNLPAIQDMNALHYLFAYQLSYIMQEGVPEWEVGTTYFIGSIVSDVATGQLFVSLIDTNVGNLLTDNTKWVGFGQRKIQSFTTSGNFTVPKGVTKLTISSKPIYNSLYAENAGFGGFLLNAADGQLCSWGQNLSGELGVGDVVGRSSPAAVLGGLNFRTVSMFNASSFGITRGGTGFAWGTNGTGVLGVGDTTPRSSPVAIVGTNAFIKIFGNVGTAFGQLPSRTLVGWGTNSNGQIGDNSSTGRNSPVAVSGGKVFSDIIAQDGESIVAVDTAGACWAWGFNGAGELGVGDVASRSSPVAVLGSHTFTQLYMTPYVGQANNHLYVQAIDNAGAGWGWGGNTSGQLGDGTTAAKSSPVAVLGSHVFTQMAVADEYVLAIDAAGAAWAWGINTNGQLGVGDVVSRSSPVAVLGGIVFSQVFTDGFNNSFGVTAAGVLYAWGNNNAGVLGVGDVIPRSSPVAVLGGLGITDFRIVTASNADRAAVGVTGDGIMYAWGGSNTTGILGVGDNLPRSSPVAVIGGRRFLRYMQNQFTELTVVPGTVISVDMSGYYARFGSTVVGQSSSQIDVEYFQ